MDEMLFHTFQYNDLGDGAQSHIIEAFLEILKSKNSTPFFEPSQSKSTQLGTTMLLYYLKVIYGMHDACFSTTLR